MTPHGYDPDLVGAVGAVFGKAVDPAVVAAAETDGLSGTLWNKIAELGFPLVGVDEGRGGSGGTVLDALAIAVLTGRYVVPLPVVETHLAAWLLADAGLEIGTAPMSVAPGTPRDDVTVHDGRASGVLHDVAWAHGAERVVALLDGPGLLVLDAFDIGSGRDLADMPRNRVRFDAATVHRVALDTRALFLRGALLRAGQIAGAIDALAELTVEYCGQRHQFGKPLHAFQAVQQHLVTLAQSAELAGSAVARAGSAATGREASFEICSAKLVAGQCAAAAVRAAHQAHGAISMTREYRAQLLTRRLNSWRWEFGDGSQLAPAIGAAVADAGSFASTIASERESPEVAL